MVTSTPFGQLGGQAITLLTLSDETGCSVELLTLGAALRSITVPDRRGKSTDICLGYDTPEEYANQDACFGGTIGRCANRIGGASFELNGTPYSITANEGRNHLHGGAVGFHRHLWTARVQDHAVTFSRTSPHLEEGYPGNLTAEVTYTLKDGCLTITYDAVSDQDTVVNLTNHAYFNLAGHDQGPVDDHILTVHSSRFTPCDSGNVPTGELRPVEGSPLDLREGASLGAKRRDSALSSTRGFDHNFVLDAAELDVPAATLICPRTGIGMELSTTMPGMQVYSAGFLTSRKGKEHSLYDAFHAVCLETQFFPDAVHHSLFPSPILRAGEHYHHATRHRFFTVD